MKICPLGKSLGDRKTTMSAGKVPWLQEKHYVCWDCPLVARKQLFLLGKSLSEQEKPISGRKHFQYKLHHITYLMLVY